MSEVYNDKDTNYDYEEPFDEEMDNHPKFGQQFKASHYELYIPTGLQRGSSWRTGNYF